MPDAVRKNISVPFDKNKGDVRDCGNFRGISLTSHSLKMLERVLGDRLCNLIKVVTHKYHSTTMSSNTYLLHQHCTNIFDNKVIIKYPFCE